MVSITHASRVMVIVFIAMATALGVESSFESQHKIRRSKATDNGISSPDNKEISREQHVPPSRLVTPDSTSASKMAGAATRGLQNTPTSSNAIDGAIPEGFCPCSEVQQTACPSAVNQPNATLAPLTLQILVVDSPGIITMVKWNADDYFKFTNGRVKVNINLVPTMPQLFQEIENDARAGGSLFDAYYTNPVILGSAAVLGGFLDLTPYVKSSPYADWTDVLLALRNYVTSFEDKIYIVLLDGDTHTMFYRKDVLSAFNLTVPRTWNEYNEVAKAIHGRTFNGIKMSGSCVSRIQGDHALYWYHLVLSTITQTQGTSEGSLFDPTDMTPLTGEALAEMLRVHEEMSKYGSPDEYSDIINHVQNGHMNDGSCGMTFMWGDLFRRSKAEGSILHDKLGIAPTPGSEVVLDRATGKLVPCDKERCPYAIFYDDIGFVNSAPYAANGGWGAAISAHTTLEKQEALADFFLWASSREQSEQYVIPNATLPWDLINGQDPWRKSQLDVDKWVERGFEREVSKQYVQSILSNLVSKNVVIEARFPKAGEIMSVLDKDVNEYLVEVKDSIIPENDRITKRLKTAQRITDQWKQIIRAYDARGDTVAPILEIYQRLRGVYVPNENFNYLTRTRPIGLTLMAIVWSFSIGAAVWVYLKRENAVVKASQPPFLWLICVGTFVLSSSIIVMGIDESAASTNGCSAACIVTPWLISLGFTITYAALCSKILRLKILMQNAAQFRRIKVSVKDVILPFVAILVVNTVFLIIWTVIDPPRWSRQGTGRTESGERSSFGKCSSDGNTSVVMMSLLVGADLLALVAANILAYKTKDLSIAFDESKYVGLSMASILQAVLVGGPLIFLADSNPTARYMVRSILIFVVCMSVLLFMFIPKIALSRKSKPEMLHLNLNMGRVSGLRRSTTSGSFAFPPQGSEQFNEIVDADRRASIKEHTHALLKELNRSEAAVPRPVSTQNTSTDLLPSLTESGELPTGDSESIAPEVDPKAAEDPKDQNELLGRINRRLVPSSSVENMEEKASGNDSDGLPEESTPKEDAENTTSEQPVLSESAKRKKQISFL